MSTYTVSCSTDPPSHKSVRSRRSRDADGDLADAGEFGSGDDAAILTVSGDKYGPPETRSATASKIDREDVPDAIDGLTS